MSETSNQNGSGSGATRPRLWPAVLIVATHLGVSIGSANLSSTNIQSLIGLALAPLLSAFLLTTWWLVASRVPWRERLAGAALSTGVILWIGFSHGSYGMYLLVIALPILTTGVVALLVLTPGVPWPTRRWIPVVMMVGCAVVFSLLRVDAVGGDLVPLMSWRWNSTSEELYAASATQSKGGTAALPSEAGPGDWPGFRGAKRDGRVLDTTFSTNWSVEPPRELWRIRVGLGWSSFAVVGDYIFTQEQRGQDESVVCYAAETGEVVWVNSVSVRFDESMGSGPRATPTFYRGRLYTQGSTGVLQCLDASTGATLWKRDLVKDTGAKVPMWGFASSPLVTEDSVIVFSGASEGKSVVSYKRDSGELVWTAGEGNHGYASGQISLIEDVPQLLMISNYGLQSFEPTSGKALWEHSWDMGNNARVVQPCVVGSNSILIGTSFMMGTRMLKVNKNESGWKVEEEWTSKKFRPYFNDFVYHQGHCYGFDGNRFMCVDGATGERKWKGARLGGQVLLFPEMDVLLVLSEKGEVVLIQAATDVQNEVARFKAISGKTWNHPVVSHGKLFVRNSEEAACFQLSS